MSQENVEIVREVYEAAARRDTEAVLALYDPHVEWDWTRATVGGGLFGEAGLFRGRENLRRWFREWSEGLDKIEYEAEEVVSVGDHVISKANMRGSGRTTGIQIEDTLYAVWTIRNGKIARVVWFASRADALEAAGLSE